jgi:hypothetical protein
MHELMTPHVVAVMLGLVDDGELLVYPSNLWLPGGFTMLQLSSR